MQTPLRRKLAVLMIVALATMSLAPGRKAAAQVSGFLGSAWTDQLPSTSTSYWPRTHAGGGVSVSYADPTTRQQAIKTMGSNREQFGTTLPSGKTLAGTGKNGDLYLLTQDTLTAQTSSGAVRWTATAPTNCASSRYASNVVTGSDGHVYMLVTPPYNANCSGAFQLVKIDATTGSVVFAQPLGNTSPHYYSLHAHKAGVVVVQDQTVRHFSNNGASGVQFTGPSNSITVNADGHAIFKVMRSATTSDGCAGSVLDKVVAFNTTGIPTTTSLQECSPQVSVYPLSNGGVLINKLGNPDALIGIAASGMVAWRKTYPLVNGGSSRVGYVVTKSDSNGNVIVMQQTNTNGRYAIELQVLNASTGTQQATYSTKALDVSASFHLASHDGYPEALGLAPGRIYLPLTKCNGNICSAGLYAFSQSGLALDYPRGTVWGAQSSTPLKYVAMGDSFSSGEGVPPFATGTNTAGPPENRCHRSQNGAYAKWLDRDPALNIELVKFVACSGATTARVKTEWPRENKLNTNEGPQAEALSTTTDLVTITIGGNDIGFGDFAAACVLQDCSGTAYETIKNRIRNDLPSALRTTLAKIKERTGAQTRVLIVGYPMLMPKPEDAVTDCAYMSDMEKLAARDVVQQLNAAIELAANAARTTAPSRSIEYVNPNSPRSPFIGRELCRPGSFFNGLQLPKEYSFHPNAQGQNAYWEVIANHLYRL